MIAHPLSLSHVHKYSGIYTYIGYTNIHSLTTTHTHTHTHTHTPFKEEANSYKKTYHEFSYL